MLEFIMQTMSVQIQDNYMPQFINYVQEHNENIVISKDENLEYDPYFYERQRDLHKLREDIKNGTMEMLSQEQYNKEIKQFFQDLEN